MLKRMKVIDLIVKTCMQVKPNQHVLVIADDGARSVQVGQQVAEACTAEGAEVVMTIMVPRKYNGQEPPRSVAEAMQACDIIFEIVSEGHSIAHTNAAKAAREKGIKYVAAAIGRRDSHFDREISVDDINKIKQRTEQIAEIMSRSNSARVTSFYGTDLTMSLKGRKGLALHPLSGAAIVTVPDYAEAAISPVEGSTEGILVSEGGIRGWGAPPREPLRLSIRSGKVTEVSGPDDYSERVKDALAKYENASNCAAELGIGTTHTMPKSQMRSGVLVGTIHIAMGRNNDIGGETFSQIHNDLLIYRPSVWLDDLCLIRDGELQIP